jgi:hypothetical protein
MGRFASAASEFFTPESTRGTATAEICRRQAPPRTRVFRYLHGGRGDADIPTEPGE